MVPRCWRWMAVFSVSCLSWASVGAAQTAPQPAAPVQAVAQETQCSDRLDNDRDQLVDCADADCYADPACKAGTASENTNARCSDWLDNDGDTAIDCDDDDCFGPGITVCAGSMDKERAEPDGGAAAVPVTAGGVQGDASRNGPSNGSKTVYRPEQSMEELIGTQGDVDGERSDEVCADGIDNDNDGRTDCADFGCRYDPSVTVCSTKPSARFSVVVGIGGSWDQTKTGAGVQDTGLDARFTRLQLRALGSIPFIQNSFFLINLRAERSPRLTFAMFQVPIKGSHYLNINSGSGSLSTSLIISASRQLLLEAPFYVYNAFEQGNGAAAEVGGPLVRSGRLRYRVFAAGGSGEFNGNVGGRFFKADNQNFTWAAGAQLAINIIGSYNRFDSPFLYTPVPTTVALLVGAKYDQRANERYPATNVFFIARSNRLLFSLENYSKRELAFGSWQTAYVAQLGFLAIPKWLLLAADAGQYYSTSMTKPPASFSSSTVARPLNEWQVRAAAHLYVYRNIGIASIIYTEHHVEKNPDRVQDTATDRHVRLEAQFRF